MGLVIIAAFTTFTTFAAVVAAFTTFAAVITAIISAPAVVVPATIVPTAILSTTIVPPIVSAAIAIAAFPVAVAIPFLGGRFIGAFVRTAEQAQDPVRYALIFRRIAAALLAFLCKGLMALDECDQWHG